MKEATGEANMTVVTIILIAVVVAVATPIVQNMMKSTQGKADCMNGGGYCVNGTCQGGEYNGKSCKEGKISI